MADTRIFKQVVEPFVREWLAHEYGVSFEARALLLTGARLPQRAHGFDAVSTDGRIVAGINGSSGKTSGGGSPAGKFHKAYQELYFLNLINAEKKLLVTIHSGFSDLLRKETEGRLAPGIEIKFCPLTAELEAEVDRVRRKAASEVGG